MKICFLLSTRLSVGLVVVTKDEMNKRIEICETSSHFKKMKLINGKSTICPARESRCKRVVDDYVL